MFTFESNDERFSNTTLLLFYYRSDFVELRRESKMNYT